MVFNQRSDDGTIDIFLKRPGSSLDFHKNVDTLEEAEMEKEDFYRPLSKREALNYLSSEMK